MENPFYERRYQLDKAAGLAAYQAAQAKQADMKEKRDKEIEEQRAREREAREEKHHRQYRKREMIENDDEAKSSKNSKMEATTARSGIQITLKKDEKKLLASGMFPQEVSSSNSDSEDEKRANDCRHRPYKDRQKYNEGFMRKEQKQSRYWSSRDIRERKERDRDSKGDNIHELQREKAKMERSSLAKDVKDRSSSDRNQDLDCKQVEEQSHEKNLMAKVHTAVKKEEKGEEKGEPSSKISIKLMTGKIMAKKRVPWAERFKNKASGVASSSSTSKPFLKGSAGEKNASLDMFLSVRKEQGTKGKLPVVKEERKQESLAVAHIHKEKYLWQSVSVNPPNPSSVSHQKPLPSVSNSAYTHYPYISYSQTQQTNTITSPRMAVSAANPIGHSSYAAAAPVTFQNRPLCSNAEETIQPPPPGTEETCSLPLVSSRQPQNLHMKFGSVVTEKFILKPQKLQNWEAEDEQEKEEFTMAGEDVEPPPPGTEVGVNEEATAEQESEIDGKLWF